MKQIFSISGIAVVDTEAGTIDLGGAALDGPTPPSVPPQTPPPVVPPMVVTDAIDLAQAVMTAGSPDIRKWPIGAKLTAVGLSGRDNMTLEFSARNGPGAWPFVIGAEGGEIQYTLGVGCKIGGVWQLATVIRCISRAPDDNYVPTGPVLQPGQLPGNIYYYAGSPLAEYQPAPGEQVAWFLTAGDQRRGDIHQIAERTQVVLAPFLPGVFPF